MAREIKFRAKRLDNNEFVIGYYLPMASGYRHFIYLPLEYLNEHSRIEIDPKTLGQYTGLKDKNGKEVYEGEMANMSYCRFQNTFKALKDCIEFLKENGNYTSIRDLNNLSETEMHYALRLGNLCREFLEFTENREEND